MRDLPFNKALLLKALSESELPVQFLPQEGRGVCPSTSNRDWAWDLLFNIVSPLTAVLPVQFLPQDKVVGVSLKQSRGNCPSI